MAVRSAPSSTRRWRASWISGWYILGPEVEAFEREFAAYCGGAVRRGRQRYRRARARAARARRGEAGVVDERGRLRDDRDPRHGGEPVYVDVDADSLSIDPARSRDTGETRAVIATHLYGRLARSTSSRARRAECRSSRTARRRTARLARSEAGRHVGRRGRLQLLPDEESRRARRRRRASSPTDAGVAQRVRRAAPVRLGGQVPRRSRGPARTAGWTSCRRRCCAPSCRTSTAGTPAGARSRRYAATIDAPEGDLPGDRRRPIDVGASLRRPHGRTGTGCAQHLRAARRRRTTSTTRCRTTASRVRAAARRVSLPVTEQLCAEVLTLPCFPELTDAEVDRSRRRVNSWAT